MLNSDTDGEWEKFGKTDPYFGVITDEKFRRSNLTDDNRKEFFRSGYDYIDHVLKKIREHIDPNYTVKKALDFGCGVGRLVIPLAKLAENVTGVDVSDSMLAEANKNCEERSIRNAAFVKSDDNLSLLDGKFDFVHSFIVFQHIPVSRGELIFKNLLSHVKDGGVCVIHFTYAKDYHININKLVRWGKKYIPLLEYFSNLVRGKDLTAPQMQMNPYDLNRLFFIIQKANVSEIYVEYSNHGGELGVVVYFKKPEEGITVRYR